MRGKLGPILSGIGGFLLVLGLLLNVYAYPRLAVAPLDQASISKLSGPDARVFDSNPEVLAEFDTDLTSVANTVGKVAEAEKLSDERGERIAVWDSTLSTKDADGILRAANRDLVAFDQFTGEAVDWNGAWSEAEANKMTPTKFKGQVFKFPFQTKKQTYQWWDGTLGDAFPAKFVKEEDFRGMKTYVFKQVIDPTVWTTQKVPPSVVDEVGKEALEVDRSYSNTRTFWVEPETGVVINRVEEQYSTLQFEGEDRTILTDVTTQFSEETVKQNLADYESKPALLKMIRVTLPLVFGIGGLLLLVVGLLLSRRRSEA